MRPALINGKSWKFALVGCIAVAMAGAGCEVKSFLNPGEVGRFRKSPLLVPILPDLGTGIEEPDDQFANATDVQPEDLVAEEVDYVIGRNDLLNISITDVVGPGVETVKQVRVSESGNVSLPLIGQVRAEGLTEAQLETEIQRGYREANLMPNTQVSVIVAQAMARTFNFLGSVMRPGPYAITQADFRVLDALVSAGDINSQGVDYVYVIRRLDAGPRRAPAGAAPQPGQPGAQPAQPGDVLQPRSSADGLVHQPVMMVQNGQTAPSPGEGKYIIVDGKPVLVGANQPATAQPGAGAGPATPPAPTPTAPAPPPRPAAPEANTPAVAAPPSAPATGAAPGMGAAPHAGRFEFRNPMTPENTRIIRVPVTQLKNGDLRYNIVIKPQDTIIAPLPLTGEYYIDGHINRGGVYSLTARKITLKQAIAAAGGFDQVAMPFRTDVIRRIGEDKEVVARVNLDKVFSMTQPDIYLKPYDTVRVGTNLIAPFLAAFRNGFRITYGFGFLYDRNYAPQQEQDF